MSEHVDTVNTLHKTNLFSFLGDDLGPFSDMIYVPSRLLMSSTRVNTFLVSPDEPSTSSMLFVICLWWEMEIGEEYPEILAAA